METINEGLGGMGTLTGGDLRSFIDRCKMSTRAAAVMLGVPRTTVRRWAHESRSAKTLPAAVETGLRAAVEQLAQDLVC